VHPQDSTGERGRGGSGYSFEIGDPRDLENVADLLSTDACRSTSDRRFALMGAIRFSLGRWTTQGEIDSVMERLTGIGAMAP
jgi:selenocysteine lyase/cysteine desulfurase